MFPVEAFSGGPPPFTHHFAYLNVAVLLVFAVVWDNYRQREPMLVTALAATGLLSFLNLWPAAPAIGAATTILCSVGIIVTIAAGWVGFGLGDVWDDYPIRYRVAAILLELGALDDAIQHGFGIPTPLDWLWKNGGQDNIGFIVGVILVVLIIGSALNYRLVAWWKG